MATAEAVFEHIVSREQEYLTLQRHLAFLASRQIPPAPVLLSAVDVAEVCTKYVDTKDYTDVQADLHRRHLIGSLAKLLQPMYDQVVEDWKSFQSGSRLCGAKPAISETVAAFKDSYV